MSYSTPADYLPIAGPRPMPELKLAVPSALESDPGFVFTGARSTVKYIPASTGNSIGPSASTLFMIPQTAYGFIKPCSMYLRAKIQLTGGVGTGGSLWTFAGQNGIAPATAIGVQTGGYGGASSVINRLTVTFPGGIQCSYPQYNTWRNAILPHALSREYFLTDLAELESASVVRDGQTAAGDLTTTTIWVCIPLDLPCFNSAQAFPLCLLSGGIQIELQSETLPLAFYATGFTTAPTSYTVSDMALVYDELVVSPEFKAALDARKAVSGFTLALNDRLYMGAISGAASSRTNFGIGLNSLKSIVGTIQLTSTAALGNAKQYNFNGLSYWNLYLNGQQMTPSNLDNDAQVFAELQRSLQMLNDSNITSALDKIASPPNQAVTNRNNFCLGQFAFGASVAAYNDRTFSLSGVAADQVQVELNFTGASAEKWQNVPVSVAASSVYLWALHDTLLTILADGTLSIKK